MIKIRNQNIYGQTLNIIKYWIKGQNWKKNKIHKRIKKRIKISNELNDDGWNFNFFKMTEANPIQP
jgi:hypothetical protein